MSKSRLEMTIDLLRRQFGDNVVRHGSELFRSHVPSHVSTGFPELDNLTGCGGIPLSHLSLLTGQATSGKLTLAYKVIASLQRTDGSATAVLMDLTRTIDSDYLVRCGVDLERLLLVRPASSEESVILLLDLIQQGADLILLDNLVDLMTTRESTRHVLSHLPQLQRHLLNSTCALICIEELSPPWLSVPVRRSSELMQWPALHLAVERENWLYQHDRLVGYRARIRLLRSRWASEGVETKIDFEFNGTVEAASTW